jgi:hypothetical protein
MESQFPEVITKLYSKIRQFIVKRDLSTHLMDFSAGRNAEEGKLGRILLD